VAFPIHAHIGLNFVISDYVPKASRAPARYALLGVTALTMLGLLKLNLSGHGITETYKSLWREKDEH
jgi:succinate dehydrogenase (ubiquinone) membrane anchor subunit